MTEITIIDYGVGNLGAISNMIKRVGGTAVLARTPEEVNAGKKFILPGVGAFDHARAQLDHSGLIPALEAKVLKERSPLLGICVGFQLLGKRSDEGDLKGLGWIDAEVLHFSKLLSADSQLKIPHMGWAYIEQRRDSEVLGLSSTEKRFYFVHSYFMKCRNDEDVVARVKYGEGFAAAVEKDNIFGVQFHPEKSHHYGMGLFEGFLRV